MERNLAGETFHSFSSPAAIAQFDEKYEAWVSSVGELFLPIQTTFATTQIAFATTQIAFATTQIAFATIQTTFATTKTGDEVSLFLEKSIKLEYLNSLYTLKNPTDIKRFLMSYDYLIDQLLEVRAQIENVISENLVEIRLEYHKDPEEDYEGLFLVVRTNTTPEKSLDLLEKFDDEYWFDLEAPVRNLLTVTVRPT